MAFPVILVNNTGGSDSAASGAGPSTAVGVTGTATTSGDGLTVTLPNVDLTDVLTDGSHVVFINDATAGARNFGKITAKADSGLSTANVTVSDAFGISLSALDAWIGGKRASIGSTTSKKLFDNNGSSGDAMPGWAVEMESGHTETIASTFDLRRNGDTTSGPIILRGTSGAATLPIVTFSNNGDAFSENVGGVQFRNFEIQNSNATKTASRAIVLGGRYSITYNLKISHSTNNFWKGIILPSAVGADVHNCEVGYCADIGIAGGSVTCEITNCWIHNCTNYGIHLSINVASTGGYVITGNLINQNGDGIRFHDATTNTGTFASVVNNTFYANTSDGIELSGDFSVNTTFGFNLRNNIFSSNGGYGLNFSAGAVTAIVIAARGWDLTDNCFYNNTSGATNPVGVTQNDELTDPQFTNAAGNDFSIGTNLRAKGYPSVGSLTIGQSNTSSYVDIGAAQRQEQEVTTRFFGIST